MIVHIGSKLVISSDSSNGYPKLFPDKIPIIIPSCDAYGHGTHPTTQMCLEALELEIKRGDRVLDFGTGSGILAIAAAKLGARKVTAFDIDGCSCYIAFANIRLNGVEKVVNVFHGSVHALKTTRMFDLAVQNLYSPQEAQDLLPELCRRLSVQGRVIWSGIQMETADEAIRLLAHENFSFRDQRMKGNWVTILAANRG